MSWARQLGLQRQRRCWRAWRWGRRNACWIFGVFKRLSFGFWYWRRIDCWLIDRKREKKIKGPSYIFLQSTISFISWYLVCLWGFHAREISAFEHERRILCLQNASMRLSFLLTNNLTYSFYFLVLCVKLLWREGVEPLLAGPQSIYSVGAD